MQIRTFALNGTAALALAVFTLPAFAGESTPAEKVATDQLNQQQIGMAQGVVADNTIVGTSGQTNLDQRTLPMTPGASPTMSTNMPDTGMAANNSAPLASNDASIAAAPMSQPANGVANPSKTFATASVVASDGQTVGAVQQIMVGADGHAQTVNVALLDRMGQTKTVSIAADALSYDSNRNVLVAQMTNDQILALPSMPKG